MREVTKSTKSAHPQSGQVGPRSGSLYERVKRHVSERIKSGEWKPGARIPSEHALVAQLGVSRMTVNRALRELADQGKLVRIGGVGTFIADPKPQSALLKIADLAAEIQSRGHLYTRTILVHAREPASLETAAALGCQTGDSVYHLTCVHYENGVAVQIEDRFVNPAVAPDFIKQTFEDIPPAQWLLSSVPLTEIEHVVEALTPSAVEASLLGISMTEPCLVLVRRTWSHSVPVTFARFVHPGRRYRLGGRYVVKDGTLIG